MNALGSCFPASPFAHSGVCGWQWPGHVLTPKGPAPTVYRAHTCSLSGIYRPDTRSRLPLAYGQTCHSTVPTHCCQDLPYHSYQGACVYATSAKLGRGSSDCGSCYINHRFTPQQRSRQIRNAYITIDFLNKIVWLIIPIVLKYNNQQQVYMILIKLNTHVALL